MKCLWGFTVAVVLCAVVGSISAGRADILWDQGPGVDTLGWNSNTNSTLSPYKFADNFVLTDASTIDSIEWWAMTADGTYVIAPDLSNVASYTIEFYTDAGGVGSLIASEVIPIGSIGVSVESTWLMRMTTALSTPVTLAAGSYWVAINATLTNPNGNLMTWAMRDPASPRGDNVLDYDSGPDGVWEGPYVTAPYNDPAYRLGGSVIPAPDAGLLGLSGLLLVGLLQRNVTG